MTLTEFQTTVHALYRGDGSTPTSGSTKWTHRQYLLWAAINMWKGQNILWNELLTTLTNAADGSKTVLADTLQYSAPTDFERLTDYVLTKDANNKYTYYSIIQPHQADLYLNQSKNCAYISGNKSSGYKVNFLKQPTVGDTIDYSYYKSPSEPSATTDVIEMADPYFSVYFVLGKLHEQEGAGDRARGAFSMAEQKLDQMKIANDMLPHYQENTIPGPGYGNFGQAGTRGFSRYGASL